MLKDYLTPKKFLQIGGVVLVLIGVLGAVGIIGPTPEKSIFGVHWYFSNVEIWSYITLGVVALAGAYVVKESMQRWLVMLYGAVALFFGVLSLFLSSTVTPNIGSANLERPMDTILLLLIAAWAFSSVWETASKSSKSKKSKKK